jgi:hypothetical protein
MAAEILDAFAIIVPIWDYAFSRMGFLQRRLGLRMSRDLFMLICVMNEVLNSIVSKFETQQQADSYDRGFCAKVQAALGDPRSLVPNDEVARRMEERFAALRKLHSRH